MKPEPGFPRRIVCLTTEMTELVFALGAGDRIVGVSGYSTRPAEARKKEKVAAFTSARMEKIDALRPDLILGFSDLQKDIARDLIACGYPVFISNQRSLEEIGDMVLAVARLVGREQAGLKLRRRFFNDIKGLSRTSISDVRPRVYFEEWNEPMISGILWVSELIERLGGEDVFKSKSCGKTAADRTVSREEVAAENPDIILASWCGKKVNLKEIASRPGWEKISAVKNGQIFEIKSADILSPGLSLAAGARQISDIFAKFLNVIFL